MLALPDRQPALELLDDVARCLVRLAAVRMRDGDCHARVAQPQVAHAVLDDDVRRAPPLCCLERDRRQLALRHPRIRAVVQCGHRRAFVHVADRSDEQNRRAIAVSRDFREQRTDIEVLVHDRGSHGVNLRQPVG